MGKNVHSLSPLGLSLTKVEHKDFLVMITKYKKYGSHTKEDFGT